jgi:hypothetical protein
MKRKKYESYDRLLVLMIINRYEIIIIFQANKIIVINSFFFHPCQMIILSLTQTSKIDPVVHSFFSFKLAINILTLLITFANNEFGRNT